MKSRNSRAETCLEQGESTAWLPPDRTGRPKERVRLDCERILRPERMEEKNQMGEAIRIAAPSSLHGQCGVLETGFGRDFRAAGIEQRCRAGASPKPARNRLDSRSARKWNACFESLTAASRKGMPGSFSERHRPPFLRRLSPGRASWAQRRSQRQSEQRVCRPLPFPHELIFPIWSVLWRELRRAARRVPAGSFSPRIFPRSGAGRY